ncbi:MAG TPA: sugar transferase, partial [Candidatus Saccharimonadales bacterium]|nr:sugar transferase [Candidatus Saccharimonadales bacterium]
MKRGLEFHASPSRGSVDRFVASLLQPAIRLAERRVARLIREAGLELPAITTTERVGYLHKTLRIQKFTTVNPATGEFIGRWARMLHTTGLDEMAQINNILDGDMHFFGWRALYDDPEGVHGPIEQGNLVHTYQGATAAMGSQSRAEFDMVIDGSKPGIFSSYSHFEHTAPRGTPISAERRAQMNVADYEAASVAHDALIGVRHARVAARFAARALLHR